MKNFLRLDWIFLVAVFLLLAVSLLALYSVSTVDNRLDLGHFQKQIFSIFIGLAAMFALAFFDYRVFSAYSTKLYFSGLILLATVFLLGTTVRGTTGWLGFGGLNFQPVEIVKVIMIIFLASFLAAKKTKLSLPVRIVASIVLVFIPFLLIVKQPDFGSASIIIFIWMVMLLVSGINKKNILALSIAGIAIVFFGSFFLKDYQKDRLVNFVSPYNDPQGSGYNVIQSMVAVGSGGIFGKGLGHGSQSQLNFLPEKHTDFIFAVIAEELGLVGAFFVLGIFFILLYRIKEASRLARDNFGFLLSVGAMAMIFGQILINIGMNIGLVPVAGVPLPLVSYGGSSLVSVMLALGIVQSVYLRRMKTL